MENVKCNLEEAEITEKLFEGIQQFRDENRIIKILNSIKNSSINLLIEYTLCINDKEIFMKESKQLKIFKIIKEHIINNKKEYIIVFLIFIIGIFSGVFFINHLQETPKTEITNYLNQFIEKFKGLEAINHIELLKNTIIQNILLAISIWFFGTTVIGIPIVFGIILYRGFCLGYTISLCITIMGLGKGISFVLVTLLLQNILLIPAILALAVSGVKLYKSIVRDKRKENIKLEILRHTIFSTIMLIVLIIAAMIEIFMSTNLLKTVIKYF